MTNHDPLAALDEFYQECRQAVPPSPAPVRRHAPLLIAATGLSIGFAAALAIASFPGTPSQESCKRAVQAIALRQEPAPEPLPKQSLRATHAGRKTWRV
jgi:hypothetical protein